MYVVEQPLNGHLKAIYFLFNPYRIEWKRKCHDIFKLFCTLFMTYVVHALCLSHVQWVTIHNARNIYIRRRRVPLSEVYSSISENFHLAYTSGIEQSCVEVRASVWYSWSRWDSSPSRPRNLEGWPVFERNCLGAAAPDARFGDNIHDPTERSESWQFP